MTKKLTKRIISFAVTLAMVMVLLPTIPAMAAAEATTAATLAQALDPEYSGTETDKVKVEGDTVTLKQNVDITSYIDIKGGTLTLDLGDYDITRTNGPSVFDVCAADTSLTIKGNGTITNKSISADVDSDMLMASKSGASLTIEGNVTIKNNGQSNALGIKNGGTVTMNGGTINGYTDGNTVNKPAVYIEKGSFTMTNGNVTGGVQAVAIGGTVNVSGGTIEGPKDGILVSGAINVNISGDAQVTGATNGIVARAGATLNITGGQITGTAETGVAVYGGTTATISGNETVVSGRYGATAATGGKLKINGGKVTGSAAGVGVNGIDDNAETAITVTGGTVEGTGDGVGAYLPAGTMNVSGDATVKGKAGIVVRGGDLDVQGGTIEATYSGKIRIGDAANEVPAAGITVDNAEYKNQKEGQKHVTIGGDATVKAPEGGKTLAACNKGTDVDAPAGKVADKDNPFSVSGGTFTTGTDGTTADSNVNQFLADGYDVGADGSIEEKVEDPEVTLNDVKCATLKEALEKAGNGDTITLLKDVVISEKITLTKKGELTIDLGNNSITRNGDLARVFEVSDGASLTIKGQENGTIKTTANTGAILLASKDSKITIEGGTIDASYNSGTNVAIAANQSGAELNITGGTITGKGSLVAALAGAKIKISGGKIIQTEELDDMCAVYVQTGTADTPSEVTIEKDAYIDAVAGVMVSDVGNNKLTVTGGTIEAQESAVYTNGSSNAAELYTDKQTITISGGKLISKSGTAMYLPGKGGDVTISGEDTEITGAKTGIEVRSGKLTVEGGKITGGTAATETGTTPVGGGPVTSNAGIGIAPYGNQNIDLTVKGGTISGGTALYQSTPADGNGATFTFDVEGGTFEGVESAVSVDNDTLKATNFVKGGTFTKGESDAKEADVAVSQYIDSTNAVNPETGEIKAENEVGLAIVDFGYIADSESLKKTENDNKFTSERGIEYNCTDWVDATFYWCFNRPLKEGETVTVTFTAPNGKAYTDTCNGIAGGTSPRYAVSFLNGTQLGDDVNANGFVTGDYTISGKIGGGSETDVVVPENIKTAKVENIPEELAGTYTPVVAAATLADTSNNPIGDEATELKAEYVGTTIIDGKTVYNIKGIAKNLKKHKNVNDVEGYWFGIEIKAPDGVDAAGTYAVTVDDESAGTSSFDKLENVAGADTGDVKGAIIYLDVKDGDTHTVVIDWDNDAATENSYTYAITLKEVERYGAASFVEGETNSFGFTAKSNNELLNSLAPLVKGESEHWGNTIDDCVDNTFYAAFKVEPNNTEGKSYTVKFAKDGTEPEQSYSAAVPNAEKGGIVYFTPVYQSAEGGSGNISTENYQGKYTVTVTKTGDTNPDDTAEIKVYKIVYKAVNGKFGEAAEQDGGLYATSVTEADAIIGTKPEVTPNDGFKAAEWGEGVASDEDYTITYTATCSEIEKYTVTCETATGGQVTADKTADLAEGDTVTLTVTPDSGYSFESLSVKDSEGTEVETTEGTDGTYTFTMPASNVTVTATFAADVAPTTYTVTCETVTGGQVTADKTADLAEGDTVTLTVTPDSGYSFESLTVKDADGAKVETTHQADGTYTFTMPASNITVTATFAADVAPTTYTVTIVTATGGQVTADKTADLAEGDTVKLTVTADSSYNFGSLTVKDADGTKVETTRQADGTYTFTMPASDVTVTATFSRKSTGGGRGGSGGGSASGGETSYSVSVPSKSNNGSVSADLKSATKGSKVTFTVTPDMGYMASGVTVKDANGSEIAVTDNGDGTYTFVMPDSKVSIAAEFVKKESGMPETKPTPGAEENCPSAKFADVDQSQWYHEGIDYALTNGLMNGMSDTTFEPNSTTTRAMVVAVLYRLDGSPTTAQAGFADVPADAWYADAVAWGEANGVVSGYSAETFGPNDSITREQMAAILYRYAQYKGIDVSAQADLSKYSDADAVSDWADTALGWANAEGLISGMSGTELAPTDTATRAQVASILMRFCENIVK